MRHEIQFITLALDIGYQFDVGGRFEIFKGTGVIHNGLVMIAAAAPRGTRARRDTHGERSRHIEVGFLNDLCLAFGHAQGCPECDVLFDIEKNVGQGFPRRLRVLRGRGRRRRHGFSKMSDKIPIANVLPKVIGLYRG